ncbi:hypothetical protein [Microbacterium sp.]|uniref:hypothetical protein n=1 Tax=Microbacterium sp. TaxID=51671 RepID=UPI00092B98D7|nr:hypothetical protein [Microbacterium sp.]MBN9187715.1 hypothetical protein [Microbacterium sp.]MBN9194271.1 hypothetical protein [Microbacterium sp.]OJU62554.1 MAG: hypothetical protein BGO04_05860 [Microbacterium sp. 70-38]
MRTAARITTAVCVVAIAGLVALAAPAIASGIGAASAWSGGHRTGVGSSQAAPRSVGTAVPSPTPTAGASSCVAIASVDWRDSGHSLTAPELLPTAVQVATGTPVDRGTRSGAEGLVRMDAGRHPVGYTVAAGDAPMAIGARFCMDYVSILHFNGYWVTGDGKDIAPGDYLYLAPDPRLVHPYQHPTHKPPTD